MVQIIQRTSGKETTSAAVKSTGEALITVIPAFDEGADFACRTAGGEFPAKLVFRDPKSHLALLTVDEIKPPQIAHADSRSITPDSALHVLMPETAAQPVRFGGRVKQLEGEPLLLTLLRFHAGGAKLIPGSAIFDQKDNLIALILSSVDETGAWLAVPIEAALKVAADVKRSGRAQTGELEIGIAVGTTTPAVEFVKPGSRAEKAGLKAGDIILQVGDRSIAEALDILDANFYLTPSEPTLIRVLRGLDIVTTTAPAP